MPQSNYSAQFKEKDSHALTLGYDFQGSSEVSQVKIMPFADCCAALKCQFSTILSYFCRSVIIIVVILMRKIAFYQQPLEAFQILIFKNPQSWDILCTPGKKWLLNLTKIEKRTAKPDKIERHTGHIFS